MSFPDGTVDIALTGAGRLAQAVCLGLARLKEAGLRVAVLARSGQAAEQVCAAARSVAMGTVSFRPLQTDLSSQDCIEARLCLLQPRVIVGCVSHHSPWEAQRSPSQWTDLIAAAGFGVTLPLQWPHTARLARAIARQVPTALFVNGCFPDAVNALLHSGGLPVVCGIGNVGSLAEALCAKLRIRQSQRLQVLAHHGHLSAPRSQKDEALVWLDGKALPNVGSLLQFARVAGREYLCSLGGLAAARLLKSLCRGEESFENVPGPQGLPGGYPVRIRSSQLEIHLPACCSQEYAVSWNQEFARRDGLLPVSGAQVRFVPRARELLREAGCELADGFSVDQLDEACEALLPFREHLRCGRPIPNNMETLT